MGFWIALVVSLVMTVVGELLRPKQKVPNAKASGLDDFDIPTAEEGRSIPIFCGKVKVKGPNVVAYGDLESIALKKKVKTGLFSSKKQTYAHKYYLGMQMMVSHGDETLDIHEIHFGDSMPAHTRTDEGNGCIRFDFDDENFYGGKEKEGGVSGTLRFYTGTDTQGANAYLAALTGKPAPAYQGLAHAMLEKMYLGTSPYIKTVAFIVSRYPNTLAVTGGKHKIGDDANPVCFIYEILTNPVWGVGLSGSDIDQTLFRAVADTIYDEGYGVSLLYNGGASAKDIIADILRHIDGIMFSDPQTGLVSMRLARKDYDIETIPVYGPDDFEEGINFARPAWLDTKNVVKSTYVDRDADYTTAIVAQQDLANITQRGGEVSAEEIDFTGFSAYLPTALATARALKTLSYPLARMTGALDRRAWKTKPGDVFALNWPELGIDFVVFRINTVRYGGLDKNDIGIEAVEDIFSISDVAYVQPPPTTWTNPLVPPQQMLAEYMVDMPYGMEPWEGSTLATFGYRSNGLDEGYAILSDRVAPYTSFEERDRSTSFTPYATLLDAYPATELAVDPVGFTIQGLRGEPDVGSTEFALIVSGAGQEWVAYTNVFAGVVSPVTRGVFDTVPIDHPAGAYVFFASSGYGLENEGNPYTVATTVHAKLLPYNSRGLLALADATELTVATNRRASRPLPPGLIRVDGVHPYLAGTIDGAFSVSWASRNRLWPELLTQDSAGVAAEDGTTYNVRAYRVDTNALLASGSGNLPTAAVQLAYTGDVRIEVESQRGGLVSYTKQSFVIDYDAAGVVTSVVTVDSAEYILDGGGA